MSEQGPLIYEDGLLVETLVETTIVPRVNKS